MDIGLLSVWAEHEGRSRAKGTNDVIIRHIRFFLIPQAITHNEHTSLSTPQPLCRPHNHRCYSLVEVQALHEVVADFL